MRILLEKDTESGGKFYELVAYEYKDEATGEPNECVVNIRFGKLNTQGQTLPKSFTGQGCRAEATDLMRKKFNEKVAEGYVVVENDTDFAEKEMQPARVSW